MPIDTGNLRFNGVKYGFTANTYIIINVGGYTAPYFEALQDKEYFENQFGPSSKKNPYYKNFERVTFSPVFNYLKFALNGKFGGGRFLVQKTMNAKQAENIVERSIDINLLQRERVLKNIMGGR